MKKISKILFILSIALFASSCGGSKKKGPEVSTEIVAEWHLTSVSGLAASAVPDVYIEFGSEMWFELYQKVGDGRYRKFEGFYTVSGSVISGQYSDGEKWGSDYKVSFDDGKLVMTAQNGSGEVCTYEKKALSETDKADAYVVTRSVEDGPRFL
ncbi:MAG: hypothetical protein IJE11_01430 [Bacteroidales bacterium]|nr:hypothetical protein [Bacteroidales bacterium]